MIDLNSPQDYLNNLTPGEFLSKYWQKRPLLIRNAFPDFKNPDYNPLSPDELAGLAMEADINSRLIFGSHRDNKWKLEYGPFNEATLTTLPDSHWSLLVSDVEKHLPDFKSFITPFRFIPDWRIDDLMVSYAPQGGSVGKHSDEYDVFLLQTHGKRRWQIEESRTQSELIEDLPLRLLKDFNPTQDWTLEPGDMLYIPPGFAHYGVAVDECMTWSIGFRAPSWQHLVHDFVDTVCSDMDESQRYSDSQLSLQQNPAQITAETLDLVKTQLQQVLNLEHSQFATWFGNAVSQQSCEFPQVKQTPISKKELLQEIESGRTLILNPYTRLAFTQVENESGFLVHIEGQSLPLSDSIIPELCLNQSLNHELIHTPLSESLLRFICDGFETGLWLWEDELAHEDEPEK